MRAPSASSWRSRRGSLLVRSLTSDPVPADRPSSPRRRRASGALAYDLDGDIYVADLDGSNAVKIADGRSTRGLPRPANSENYSAEGSMWSPDGRYLAYRYGLLDPPGS